MQTVWKWRKREGVHDLSHSAHRLQTTQAPAQEIVAVTLRKTLLLPLDDLLSIVRDPLNLRISRSGLGRCLRRHGIGNLRDLKPAAAKPAQAVQRLRTGLCACRREVPAANDRRGTPPLSVRRHRPRHALGLHAHLHDEDGG